MMVGRSDRMASLIGAPLVRLEDPRLLTGSGEYLADVRIPGTLEAAFVRSPLAHAMVRGLDPQGAVGRTRPLEEIGVAMDDLERGAVARSVIALDGGGVVRSRTGGLLGPTTAPDRSQGVRVPGPRPPRSALR